MTILILPAPAFAACATPSGDAGDIRYNNDNEVMQWCDGTDWRSFSKSAVVSASADPCNPANTPAVGQVCDDGTVYAGTTADGNLPLYTTRCDIGMTWNGSACTATNQQWFTWNNSNTTGFVDINIANCVASGSCDAFGKANTETMIRSDSDSVTSGNQKHAVAEKCYFLEAGGHNDWYLPTISDLILIYDGGSGNIGNFNAHGSAYYWSSSEYNNQRAWRMKLTDGIPSNNSKHDTRVVRCVRKGYVCQNPSGAPGDIIYNDDEHVMQWCGGGVWHKIGSPVGSSLDTGLDAHWALDDGTGSATAADSAGTNTGTLTNMETGSDWAAGPGVDNGALQFDGTDEYIAMTARTCAALPCSVTGWFYADSLPLTRNGIFRSNEDTSAYAGIGIFVSDTGQLLLRAGDGIDYQSDNGRDWNTPPGTITTGQWYHFAVVVSDIASSSGAKIYINGQDMPIGCWTGCIQGTSTYAQGTGVANIGRAWRDNANGFTYWSGRIDDIKVYNRVLSFEEATQLGNTCENPTGAAGDMIYNQDYKTPQYCNGYKWVAAGEICEGGDPSSLSFTDLTDQNRGQIATSNIIQMAGLSGCPSKINVGGNGYPQFRTCSDASCATVVQDWRQVGTIENGQYLQLRNQVPGGAATVRDTVVTVGGLSDTWSVTTGNWKLVFSTANTWGDMGGVAGADARCAALADFSFLCDGICAAGAASGPQTPGTWKVWLGGATAADDPESTFNQATVPYKLVDGTPIADNWADLTDGTLDNPINLSESGYPPAGGSNYVWSNISTGGARIDATNCNNWTSSSSGVSGRRGTQTSSTSTWTTTGSHACNSQSHVYCFEQ